MQPQAADTRTEILDVALELFLTHGYAGTSLRMIADRLGFTKAALYYHFQAKDDLILELTSPFLTELQELAPTISDKTAAGRRRVLQNYLDALLRHHAVLRLLVSDVTALQHPEVGGRIAQRYSEMQSALAGHDPSEEDQVQVSCALGVINGVAQLPEEVAHKHRATILAAAASVLATHQG